MSQCRKALALEANSGGMAWLTAEPAAVRDGPLFF